MGAAMCCQERFNKEFGHVVGTIIAYVCLFTRDLQEGPIVTLKKNQ